MLNEIESIAFEQEFTALKTSTNVPELTSLIPGLYVEFRSVSEGVNVPSPLVVQITEPDPPTFVPFKFTPPALLQNAVSFPAKTVAGLF